MTFIDYRCPIRGMAMATVMAIAITACRSDAPDVRAIPHTDSTAAAVPQDVTATLGRLNRDGEPTVNSTPSRQADPSETIRVGVLAIDSAVSAYQRYSPLLEYLSDVTGYGFTLVPLSQSSQFEAAAADSLHFILSNPLASVELQLRYGTEFIATQARPQTGDKFGGLIIVKQDSPIQSLSDLSGRHVACVDFQTAAAGCVFQIYHLQQQDIDPYGDFAHFVEIPSQDDIILAVLNGTVDAGFIRSGQLERTVAKGLMNSIDAVRVLAPMSDEFFYSHTTPLYPEWPVATFKHTDAAIAAAVEAALLKLPADHPALTSAGLEGFVPARDYASIRELIEALNLNY